MAKKHFGKIITLAAITGAAAAVISYLLKYKSFHEELDEDFCDFEDEFKEFDEANMDSEATTRSYVSLNPERQAENMEECVDSELKAEEQESCSESTEEVQEEAVIKAGETAEITKSAEAVESDAKAADSTSDSTTIVEDIIE